jgi:diacylglycerol kinase family enzyme
MKHLFIINPKSFRTRRRLDQLIAGIDGYFKTRDQADYQIYISKYPRDAIGAIRSYMGAVPADITVTVNAVGGDGILLDCLNGIIIYSNTELAVVPYGVTNNFVRAFGEGREALFRDIGLQAISPAIPTDILKCGSNYAIDF